MFSYSKEISLCNFDSVGIDIPIQSNRKKSRPLKTAGALKRQPNETQYSNAVPKVIESDESQEKEYDPKRARIENKIVRSMQCANEEKTLVGLSQPIKSNYELIKSVKYKTVDLELISASSQFLPSHQLDSKLNLQEPLVICFDFALFSNLLIIVLSFCLITLSSKNN
ncbi:hypothetical protein BpHYR1_046634 [Brachionus plicatilis]|uniref:Uncharacterized protein n=1 Tax=Brachionus plicatilis TaxID=10195 RepID=A0A3M7Q7V0_BRAPC|nr:hypothetical protein BpHYR1_046634 [Brachionus plicatilis]